jgi:hypothetical protein
MPDVFPFSIELNVDELAAGAEVGCRRLISCIHRRDKNFVEDANVAWQRHIEGTCAEVAWAKANDRYWSGCGKQGRYDAAGMQVRSVLYPQQEMPVRPGDVSGDIFVLVYAKAPLYTFCGWQIGYHCKLESFWRGDYWSVPQSALRKDTIA